MVVFPLLTVFVGTTLLGKSLQQLYPYVALAFILGMIAPSYVLDKKVEQRLTRLRNALPDALDLLVVCTESGLGLNAALLRVGHELRFVHPEFASELAVANGEIRAGLEREVALTNIVERSGLEDLKMLVMLLIQSTRLGTSLAETLRIYAEEFRDKRMQAAEEHAAQLGTKIIFPLVVCFMPTFFIIAIGPAFTGILKAFDAL
jgi:tight adherence protein C